MSDTLMIKVKSPVGIDFFDEHKILMDKYGYVDFAKIGKSIFSCELERMTPLIKDDIKHNNQLIKVKCSGASDEKLIYPQYYKSFSLQDVKWIIIIEMELLDYERFCTEYVTRNGKKVTEVVKSIAPLIYVRKRND